jgi:glycosyltransferase involved in cell wall biosynthesis
VPLNPEVGRPSSLTICHLGKFYPPATGGIETHVQTLARAQAALGARVHVVCVNHEAPNGHDVTWRTAARTLHLEERDGDVRVTRLGRLASVSRLDVCPSLLEALVEVRRAGVDIVHVHAPNPTMFLALALVPPNAPVVVTHHSDVVKQRVLGIAYGTVERLIHRRAALVLSDSEPYIAGSPALRRLGGKVRSLPLGLDLTPFQDPSPAALAYAAHLREENGEPLWLCVGRLVYYKGLRNAVDALADTPGRLLVVGRGPLSEDLKAHARARGVDGRITWADYLDADELVGAYHAATALWFPSNARSEGFGLAQVEAMASGCPVINAAVPDSGVSWVSMHDESGLTFPVDDAAALAAAARRVAADPALRARLSDGARLRARREFDHMVMARRSLALYDDILGRAGGARVRDRSVHEPRSSWA